MLYLVKRGSVDSMMLLTIMASRSPFLAANLPDPNNDNPQGNPKNLLESQAAKKEITNQCSQALGLRAYRRLGYKGLEGLEAQVI